MFCALALIGAFCTTVPTATAQDRVNATAARQALVKSLTEKAESGNADAQFALSEILRTQAGNDPVKLAYATGWLVLAAQQGHPSAIAAMTERGLPLPIVDQTDTPSDKSNSKQSDLPPSMAPPAPFKAPVAQTAYIVLLQPTQIGWAQARATLQADQELRPYLLADQNGQAQKNGVIMLGPYYSRALAIAGIERAAGLGAFMSRLTQIR